MMWFEIESLIFCYESGDSVKNSTIYCDTFATIEYQPSTQSSRYQKSYNEEL